MPEHPTTFKATFLWLFAGRIDRVAIAFVATWAIGLCLNWFFGSPVSLRTALVGVATHLCVIAIALALKLHQRGN